MQEDMDSALNYMYYDESITTASKYGIMLYFSVQIMCGGDLCPLSLNEIILVSFGVFLVAIINANNFGEL